MADFGSWDIKVHVGGMPQKLASAFGEVMGALVGAQYTPIAYVGSQLVNGTNHAILCEQVLTTGKDTTNIVMVIINERDGVFALAGIDRLVEQGGALGGIKIDVQTEIPAEILKEFDSAREGYVGAKITPKVYLGSQIVKGANRIFFAEFENVVPNAKMEAIIVIANATIKRLSFVDVLKDKSSVGSLGYAFTWMTRQNALGAPLGEWP
jgi:hypothetical protein